MGYRIEEIVGDPREPEELARFLSAFVADGELPDASEEDADPECWRRRFRWWWDSNPFCRPGTERGFLLRTDGGEIVGFSGWIPHDYVSGDRVLPSLIATTMLVRRANRDASLGLFLRGQRLRKRYQIVDGTPSPEMAAILERSGYRQPPPGWRNFYPLRRNGWHPKQGLLNMARQLVLRPEEEEFAGHVINSVEEIGAIPVPANDSLRKAVDRRSLSWSLRSGHRPKLFFGHCDDGGTLEAYLIGFVLKRRGLTALMVSDCAAFTVEEEIARIESFIGRLADRPEESGVPPEIDLILWPTYDAEKRQGLLSRREEPGLYYSLPEEWEETERFCHPYEGDWAFL